MIQQVVLTSLLPFALIVSIPSVAYAGGLTQAVVKFQSNVEKRCVLQVIIKGHLAGNSPLPNHFSSSNPGGIPIKITLMCNSGGVVSVSPPVALGHILFGSKANTKASVTDPINGNTVYSDGLGSLSVPGDGKDRTLNVNMDVSYDKNSVVPAGSQTYSVVVTVMP